MVGSSSRAMRLPSTPNEVPKEWAEFFGDLEVMVFSGSAGHPRTADDGELARVAELCVEQAHARLADDASLVAEVRGTLAESPFMPWGTRLAVQGSRWALGDPRYEKDTINEFLCLLRGPRALDMGSFWIGIVRHDETPYMTGRIDWLVRHVAGRGKKRRLLVARSGGGGAWDAAKLGAFNERIF